MAHEYNSSNERQDVKSLHDLLSPKNGIDLEHLVGNTTGYMHILALMQKLDADDDGIVMGHKINKIKDDFCVIVSNQEQLTDCVACLNDAALKDHETGRKFGMLFGSRIFEAFQLKGDASRVRSAVLYTLEKNYGNAKEKWFANDEKRYCNSVTILGEFYYHTRFFDMTPITVLGESLVELLLKLNEPVSTRPAMLLMRQIALNGTLLNVHHSKEFSKILHRIRLSIIELSALEVIPKALLLMSLDIFHNNVNEKKNPEIMTLYKYYVDEGEKQLLLLNKNCEGEQPRDETEIYTENEQRIENKPNDDEEYNENSSFYNCTEDELSSSLPVSKKWSELVSDESHELSSSEFDSYYNEPTSSVRSDDDSAQQQHIEPVGNDAYRNKQEAGYRYVEYNPNEDESSSSDNWRRSPVNQRRYGTGPQRDHANTRNPFIEYNKKDQNSRSGNWRRSPVNQRRDDTYPLRDHHNNRISNYDDDHKEQEFENPPHHSGTYSNQNITNTNDNADVAVTNDNSLRLYTVEARRIYYQQRENEARAGGGNKTLDTNGGYKKRFDEPDGKYSSDYRNYNPRRNYVRGRHGTRQTYETPPRFQQQQQQKAAQKQNENYRSDYRRRHNGGYQNENDYESESSYGRRAGKPSGSKYNDAAQ